MSAVFKRELYMYMHGFATYVFAAFLLVFTGVGSLIYNLNSSVANFEYVLNFISMIFIVLIPILTMKTLSEERKQRTDQLLYSLPITSTDIVAGKFCAMLIVFLMPMVIISLYPLLFSRFGDVYLPASYGSIFAFFLLGMTLLSIGMFISSLTESQGIAAGICVAVMIVLYYLDTLAKQISSTAFGAVIGLMLLAVLLGFVVKLMTKSGFAGVLSAAVLAAAIAVTYVVKGTSLEGLLPAIMGDISLFARFLTFVNGIFDVTAVVYYLSVTAFFLFLSVQSFEKRRYNG